MRIYLSTLLLMLAWSSVAWAQGGPLTTSIAPGRVEQLVNPGSKVEDVITFTNQGDVPVEVSVSIVDFDVDEAGAVTELPPGSHASTIAPYFRISPLRMTVAAKEQAHFRYAVRTPDAFDQVRAFVYFDAQPILSESGGKQVLFATAMGIPFYVENRKAAYGALTVHDIAWERVGEKQEYVQLTLSVTNEGARNIRPGGFLTVQADDDSFLETFDVNTGSEVVLPGHERRLTMQFGPIPNTDLSLKLRFETSLRSTYQAEHHIARQDASPPASEQSGDRDR